MATARAMAHWISLQPGRPCMWITPTSCSAHRLIMRSNVRFSRPVFTIAPRPCETAARANLYCTVMVSPAEAWAGCTAGGGLLGGILDAPPPQPTAVIITPASMTNDAIQKRGLPRCRLRLKQTPPNSRAGNASRLADTIRFCWAADAAVDPLKMTVRANGPFGVFAVL